ncbi:MAG: ISNCY family transposase, partial [Conexivisphaerales archaeon]
TIGVYQEGETRGRPEMLTLEQKVKLLLIKQFVGESNRMFANMLDIFSMVSGMDVSYKTVERLYSDYTVMMALHNLLMLRRKGVTMSDTAVMGHSLTIKRNYESYAQKLKDGAKEDHRVRLFAFTIMDLKTRLYLACGSSLKKEAFEGAMLSCVDVSLSSMRLDRYYSYPTYVDAFGAGTKVYVIPKKNSTLNGSQKWKDTMKDFVRDTVSYLEQYHKRSNSESGFSQDKKMLGWTVAQRREDRIGCALFSIGLWHNLFNLAP